MWVAAPEPPEKLRGPSAESQGPLRLLLLENLLEGQPMCQRDTSEGLALVPLSSRNLRPRGAAGISTASAP